MTKTVKTQLENLSGIEGAKETSLHVNFTCYILLQKSIAEDKKAILKEIDANKELKKKMKQNGLLKQIVNL